MSTARAFEVKDIVYPEYWHITVFGRVKLLKFRTGSKLHKMWRKDVAKLQIIENDADSRKHISDLEQTMFVMMPYMSPEDIVSILSTAIKQIDKGRRAKRKLKIEV